MISSRHVRLIEQHSDTIARRFVEDVRADPLLPTLAQLPEYEVRNWAAGILSNLGDWLLASSKEDVAQRAEQFARQRFMQSVPLHESVRARQLLKNRMIDYIRAQGFGSALEIYAAEELSRSIGNFFDALIYYFVRAYDQLHRSSTGSETDPITHSAG